jgi:hypothetical protein
VPFSVSSIFPVLNHVSTVSSLVSAGSLAVVTEEPLTISVQEVIPREGGVDDLAETFIGDGVNSVLTLEDGALLALGVTEDGAVVVAPPSLVDGAAVEDDLGL